MVDIRGVNPNCSALVDQTWQELVADFQAIDLDGNWIATRDEISTQTSSEEELNYVMNTNDFNGDDMVTLDELCYRFVVYQEQDSTPTDTTAQPVDPTNVQRYSNGNCSLLNDNYWGQVLKVSQSIDLNGDWNIDRDELLNFFTTNGIDQDVDEALAQVDSNGDGLVSIDELCFSAYLDQTSSTSSDNTDTSSLPTYEDYLSVTQDACYLFHTYTQEGVAWTLSYYDTDGDFLVTADELFNNPASYGATID